MVIILTTAGGGRLYWNGKAWTGDTAAARRYREGRAFRKAMRAALGSTDAPGRVQFVGNPFGPNNAS